MVRVQTLFESTLVRVDRIDHPAGAPHVDPPEEIGTRYSIGLLERGEFRVRHRGRRWRMTPRDFFLTAPGEAYSYEHDAHADPPDDVCVAVSFADAVQDDAAGLLGSLDCRDPRVPLNNRRAYLRGRLFGHLTDSPAPLSWELLAIELLEGVLDTDTHRLYGSQQLSWYARRVDRARLRLDEDFASDHALGSLAGEAGMSPFHFARVFRALTGVPPHRYLIRRRLAAARLRLQQGASVTDTCYAVGFVSLSHFITSFRRAFGASPSKFNGRAPRLIGAAGTTSS